MFFQTQILLKKKKKIQLPTYVTNLKTSRLVKGKHTILMLSLGKYREFNKYCVIYGKFLLLSILKLKHTHVKKFYYMHNYNITDNT